MGVELLVCHVDALADVQREAVDTLLLRRHRNSYGAGVFMQVTNRLIGEVQSAGVLRHVVSLLQRSGRSLFGAKMDLSVDWSGGSKTRSKSGEVLFTTAYFCVCVQMATISS